MLMYHGTEFAGRNVSVNQRTPGPLPSVPRIQALREATRMIDNPLDVLLEHS